MFLLWIGCHGGRWFCQPHMMQSIGSCLLQPFCRTGSQDISVYPWNDSKKIDLGEVLFSSSFKLRYCPARELSVFSLSDSNQWQHTRAYYEREGINRRKEAWRREWRNGEGKGKWRKEWRRPSIDPHPLWSLVSLDAQVHQRRVPCQLRPLS